MKKFFAAVVCAIFVAVTAAAQQPAAASGSSATAEPAQTAIAPPLHPITREQTKELFQVAGVQSMLRTLVRQTITAQKANAPEWIPASIYQEMEEGFMGIDFGALLYPTYAKYLSEEDAAKVIAFYRTPEGQHFVQVTPFVMSEAGKIGQQEGVRIAQQVFTTHQQELLDAKTKYDTHRKQELEQMTNPAAPDTPKPQH
jgi:hypothetical protein